MSWKEWRPRLQPTISPTPSLDGLSFESHRVNEFVLSEVGLAVTSGSNSTLRAILPKVIEPDALCSRVGAVDPGPKSETVNLNVRVVLSREVTDQSDNERRPLPLIRWRSTQVKPSFLSTFFKLPRWYINSRLFAGAAAADCTAVVMVWLPFVGVFIQHPRAKFAQQVAPRPALC